MTIHRPRGPVAALSAAGHAHEAQVKGEAVGAGLADAILTYIAHNVPTSDLEAVLRLHDSQQGHVECCAALLGTP